jgi:hypothetical protein
MYVNVTVLSCKSLLLFSLYLKWVFTCSVNVTGKLDFPYFLPFILRIDLCDTYDSDLKDKSTLFCFSDIMLLCEYSSGRCPLPEVYLYSCP